MTYGRQDIRINTKITNEETLKKRAQYVRDFADRHGVYFNLGYAADGSLMATYQTEGRTSAYCKGMMAEMKQMLKDTFNCKIEVTFSAY